MRPGDADDALAARSIEPLDRGAKVGRIGQRRGRLDQHDRPESSAGLLERREGMERDVRGRRVVRGELLGPDEGNLTAPRSRHVRDHLVVCAADDRVGAVWETRGGESGGSDGLADQRDPGHATQVLARNSAAPAARRDQEQDRIRHGSHSSSSAAIRELASPGSKWSSRNARRSASVIAPAAVASRAARTSAPVRTGSATRAGT